MERLHESVRASSVAADGKDVAFSRQKTIKKCIFVVKVVCYFEKVTDIYTLISYKNVSLDFRVVILLVARGKSRFLVMQILVLLCYNGALTLDFFFRLPYMM